VRDAHTDETKTMFGFASGFVRGFFIVFGLSLLGLAVVAVLGSLS
jgi:hypothetical protein